MTIPLLNLCFNCGAFYFWRPDHNNNCGRCNNDKK